jgi:Fe-S-cluster containining protein
VTPELRRRVLDVYAAVDAAVTAAGPRCDASGRCCRFAEYGHTLFLSQFEAEILLETAPPYSKPVGRDGCPFQVSNLCTARHERPLGCRIYFCDPAYQDTGHRITEEAVARLKQLADEFGTGWRYAPLHVFLNEADRPNTTDGGPSIMTPDKRISLPLS